MGERQFPTLEDIKTQDPLHVEKFGGKGKIFIAKVSRLNGQIAYVEPGSISYIFNSKEHEEAQAELSSQRLQDEVMSEAMSPEEKSRIIQIVQGEVSACLQDFFQRKQEREQRER